MLTSMTAAENEPGRSRLATRSAAGNAMWLTSSPSAFQSAATLAAVA